ncbi:MAG: S24 family peptidase [Alphaproteobacteria bacterium]|nr:S24 family peptidase [Alphaproteobacteria bacterium]
MKQEDIWLGIDHLADQVGVSPARLARMAGLDQAVFSAGRRRKPDGELRWPSMESLAKVLQVSNVSLGDFVNYMHGDPSTRSGFKLPTLSLDKAENEQNYDEDGFPSGTVWDYVEFPDLQDPHCFGLIVKSNQYEPVYREGDLLVCAPGISVRRGDRVVYRLRNSLTGHGGLFIGTLLRQTPYTIDIGPLNRDNPETIQAQHISWLTRIAWARQ